MLDFYFKIEYDLNQANTQDLYSTIKTLTSLTLFSFMVGGAIGSFISKYAVDYFGRRKAIIFHYLFIFVGTLFNVTSVYVNIKSFFIIGRLFYGIQAGSYCFEYDSRQFVFFNLIDFIRYGILSNSNLHNRNITKEPERFCKHDSIYIFCIWNIGFPGTWIFRSIG